MTVTIPSILITTVSISFFTLFLSHIFKHKHLLYKHGLYSICFLYILIIARGFLPFDILFLSHTVILHSQPLLFFRNLLFFDFEIIPFIPFNIVFLIIIIWIIGFTIHNYMLYKQYFQTKKSISVLQDITDPEILHIFMTAKESILPDKNISIRLVSADFVPTPAIWGIIHPVILLPDISYTTNELELIFSHEFLHYKHKDFIMKIVIEILHSIYWWNPLISKVFFPLVNQTQELFVDYSLTKNMSSDEKSSYMFTLTKTLRMQNTSIPTSVLYALADTSNNTFVRQRLECIMEPPQKQFSFLFSGGYLLLFLLSYAVTFQCAI